MTNELNLTDYLDDLSERMARFKVVDLAYHSGINIETVRTIRNYGSRANPTLQTIEQIRAAVEKLEQERKK